MKFEKLLEPFDLGGIKLRNRMVTPAMSTGLVTSDGFVTDDLLDYFEERAKGGIGLVTVGYACIDFPAGLTGPLKIVIDDDKFIPGLSSVVERIHKHGAKAAIQLAHAGSFAKRSEIGFQPVGPSPVLWRADVPRELTVEEIGQLVTRFAKGAERAKKAGFDGVEINAGSRYLILQFLSAALNRRGDQYGGDLRNRARFLLEILDAARQLVGPDYPLWARINGIEYGVKNGITLEESKALAKMLEDAGCCAVNIKSGGKYGGKRTPSTIMNEPDGSKLYLAEAIKKVVNIPVMVTGRMTPEVGEKALREGKTDLVVMGRALWADPEVANRLAAGRRDDIRPCLACDVCGGRQARGVVCAVNPALGREREYAITPTQKRKRVLVIGAGPAGLEAARVAAFRGHEVTICDRRHQLGGQLNRASKIPPRKTIEQLTAYLSSQITKNGVKVELGRNATSSWINEVKPDAVVLAIGSRYSLAVRLAEMTIDILSALVHGRMPSINELIEERMTSGRVGRRQWSSEDTSRLNTAASSHPLLRQLRGKVPEVYLAGDCIRRGGITEAIHDGAFVGRAL